MRPLTQIPTRSDTLPVVAPGSGIGALTLPEYVLGEAAERAGSCALVDAAGARRLTYAELADFVARAASGLRARGIRPGEVVGLCAPNSFEFVIAWYAALAAGATVTTINPLSKTGEVVAHLRRTRTRWLVTTTELFEHGARAAARSAGVAESFVIGEACIDASSFEDVPASGEDRVPAGLAGSRDIAFLPSSSGTTGMPKSVILTHANLVASLHQMRRAHGVGTGDTVIAALPLVHAFGLQFTLNMSLLAGATVVVLPRFELEAFLAAVQRHRVTRAEIVPPIVKALAESPLLDRYDVSSLRIVTAGAASMSAELVRACARRLGCRVKQSYGMTELAGSSHIAPDDGPEKPDSVGPAVPGVQCRVVDVVTREDVGPGWAGELLVRAPSVMLGYADGPSDAIDSDGWMHTGDIVTVDEDGWFRVTDRIKELIKYKGFQVAPAELEQLLLNHPAVADAAVGHSPDEEAGEVPKAFVVRCGAVSAEGLMAWVAERVAPYKRIRRVEFVTSIPKSPSGKILRRLLVEPPADEAADAVPSPATGPRRSPATARP